MPYDAAACRNRLQDFLEQNKLSARGLCDAAGLSSSALSQFLSGRVDSLTERSYQELADGAAKLLKRRVLPAELRGP